MIDLMNYPSMMRNVMVGGHIHHGKTSLLDMLVLETHQLAWDADRAVSSINAERSSHVWLINLDAIYGYTHPHPITSGVHQVWTHVTSPTRLKG